MADFTCSRLKVLTVEALAPGDRQASCQASPRNDRSRPTTSRGSVTSSS